MLKKIEYFCNRFPSFAVVYNEEEIFSINTIERRDFFEKSISVFMSIVMALIVLMASTNVYANDIAMYTNNTDSVKLMFNISTKGKADVVLKCTDSNNNIKQLKAVIKIQRKIGLVWTTVDNGSWTIESNSSSFSKICSVDLKKKGTYRAHFVITVSGKDGKNDKITKNVEKTYS